MIDCCYYCRSISIFTIDVRSSTKHVNLAFQVSEDRSKLISVHVTQQQALAFYLIYDKKGTTEKSSGELIGSSML